MGRTSINIALVALLFLQGVVGLTIPPTLVFADEIHPTTEATRHDVSQHMDGGHKIIYPTEVISDRRTNAMGAIQEYSQNLVDGTMEIIQTSRDHIIDSVHRVSLGMNQVVGNVTDQIQSVMENVQQKFIDTNELIHDKLEGVKESMYNTSNQALETGYNIANAVVQQTTQITENVHEAIQDNVEIAKEYTNKVLEASSNIVDNAAVKTSEVTEGVRQNLQTVIEWARNVTSSPGDVAITENDTENNEISSAENRFFNQINP